MDDDGEEFGLLGEYGVIIVPPSHDRGQWFVALAAWDQRAESYVGTPDGPICETREEAMQEAEKVMEWLAAQPRDLDLTRVWEQMQQDLGPAEIPQPRHGLPWSP